jgi:hypothetical protein
MTAAELTHFEAGTCPPIETSYNPENGSNRLLENVKNCLTCNHISEHKSPPRHPFLQILILYVKR